MKISLLTFVVIVVLISIPSLLFSQDDTESPDPSKNAPSMEEGSLNQEISEDVSSENTDDIDSEIFEEETEELSSINKSYQGLPWGTAREDLKNFIEINDSSNMSNDEISVIGPLGEDTVKYVYTFSNSVFWKVMTLFSLSGSTIDDHINEFQRIEQILTRKYGNPLRTTRNDLGTSREYLSSPFPRQFRAYYRSSWKIDNVNIELLLEVKIQDSEYDSPVFSDNIQTMKLYYYNSEFYGFAEPEPIEISEDKFLDQY
jgi:hypothetical protein